MTKQAINNISTNSYDSKGSSYDIMPWFVDNQSHWIPPSVSTAAKVMVKHSRTEGKEVSNGEVYQHLQPACRLGRYLPYGKQFVAQKQSDWNTRYKFTGHEREIEIKPIGADSPNTIKIIYGMRQTGFDYAHARYYNSDFSIFMSVDPLASKYPSLSPYMYCAGNPIMLIDPDGRLFTDFVNKETGETKHVDDGVDQIIAVSDQDFNQIDFAWFEQQSKDTWSRDDKYFQIIDSGDEIALDSDLGKIIRTVYSEMSGVGQTSDVDRQIVAESIVNRMETGLYGVTYSEILTENQYNAVGTDAYNDPYGYIKNIEKNSSYFYAKYESEINGKWDNAISASYKAYNNIGSKIGNGVVSYVSPPLKSTHFDSDRYLKNITSQINGLKGISGVWKRK